jgi:hypothetical protein
VKDNSKGFEELIEGALVIAPYVTESYRDKFESKYGHSAGLFYTPAFYDFLVLLEDTITANKNLRGLDLVNALHTSRVKGRVSQVSILLRLRRMEFTHIVFQSLFIRYQRQGSQLMTSFNSLVGINPTISSTISLRDRA